MNARLLGAADVRELAERLDLQPTKRLGQNFVHDANTVRRIVQLAEVTPGERVLEIGPGLGSLTLALLDADAEVTAVEIDPRLARLLPETAADRAPDAHLIVIEADALAIDSVPGEPAALVANLPYNISVPVLLHLLQRVPTLQRGVVMVQAEVGERIASRPGSKVYGAPSVKAAWWGRWRTAGLVSRQVFWPVPNVDSILVTFHAHPAPGDEPLRQRTFALVDAAFGQRRKMLRQALSPLLGGSAGAAGEVLQRAGIDPTARGETLTLEQFVGIARVA